MESFAAPEPAFVVIANVSKSFGALKVLSGVNLHVAKGEVVVVIGPSGSGKSTLLRCVCLLEQIEEGEIKIDGAVISRAEHLGDRRALKAAIRNLGHDVGMVFQSFNLFPHLTVLSNLTLAPRRVRGLSHSEANAQAFHLLDRVGLRDKANEYPSRLSGGQQQRAAIARALAMKSEGYAVR